MLSAAVNRAGSLAARATDPPAALSKGATSGSPFGERHAFHTGNNIGRHDSRVDHALELNLGSCVERLWPDRNRCPNGAPVI